MYSDDFDAFGGFQEQGTTERPQTRPGAYGWHWQLTLLSLALVAGLSFLMAYLTRNVAERSVWLMGLIFMVPAGAMFLAAMIMEFGMGAMTPQISRGVQVKTAALATAATFLVACLCDAIYLYGGFVGDSSDNLLFLVYENDTSGNSSTDRAVMEVLDDLHDRAGRKVQAGLFFFNFGNSTSSESKDSVVPLAPFDDAQYEKMYKTLINGHKYQASSYGHERAYEMVENSGTDRTTKIIFICDGSITYGNSSYTKREWDRDLERLRKANVVLYFMGKGVPNDGMYYVVEKSGGSVITDFNADNVLENLQGITRSEGDMLRADTTSAAILTGVMLLLEGLVIGFGLMLLLSVTGQMRVQVVISPLLAAAAFLLVKVLPLGDAIPQWILEGTAFSLLGVVLMNRNNASGMKRSAKPAAQMQTADPFQADFF